MAWTVFRFGPNFGRPFPGRPVPIEAVDELYKQMIPDLNALLPTPNPTWRTWRRWPAAERRRADGTLESDSFPEQAALIDPAGIRGMISIEQPCPPT